MNWSSLSRRWMLAFSVFTLLLTSWYSLLIFVAAYTVEDQFFVRAMRGEAERLLSGGAMDALPAWMRRHDAAATLPTDLSRAMTHEPDQAEYAGEAGRHYHLHRLVPGQPFPILVAEVSERLVVRPVRNEIIQWLVGWGLGTSVVALLMAGWVSQRMTRPVSALAHTVRCLDPGALAQGALPELPGTDRKDEVGTLACALHEWITRTQTFLAREQRFARDASHELRTPLSVMRLGLEDDDSLSGSQKQVLRLHVAQMQDTVEMLLQLARETNPVLTSATSVVPIVERWALTYARWLDAAGVSLEVEIPATFRWPVPEPVAQTVLANLLNNAVQHGGAGLLRIRAEGAELCIRNAWVASGGGAGFGLGLSIVERLLARFGGTHRLRTDALSAEVRVAFGQGSSV